MNHFILCIKDEFLTANKELMVCLVLWVQCKVFEVYKYTFEVLKVD